MVGVKKGDSLNEELLNFKCKHVCRKVDIIL